MKTRNLAILLTDIKGFTSRTAAGSRSDMVELLRRHKELVVPALGKFRGTLVKTIGDAFLVTFESPTDAVLCGVEIQEILKAHNAGKTGQERIEIRIAINSGEVAVAEDGDIFGDAVNITARLESIAEPGEVFFTEAVYLAMNKREVPSSEIGYRQFKGIPERIKVFRVLRETPVGAQGVAALAEAPAGEAQDAPGGRPAPAQRAGFWRRAGAMLMDVLIFLVIFGTLGMKACGPDVRLDNSDMPEGGADLKVENIQISKRGVELTGPEGEKIVFAKGGPFYADKAGKKWFRNSKIDVNTSGKKRVPLHMILWVLYCGVMTWRFGATPGKMILGIKIVDCDTGAKPGADKAFLRAAFSLVSLFMLLGYLWAAWQKEGRTWHDLIAGTKAVKV